jgi:uncharacterized membrane protein YdjX (TVP38/TMEM64 family)/phosphatidylserine/phosphatidylglycerophosphate/cardiolipin synthase-like enzyme
MGLFRPGDNCYAAARASRAAFLRDAAQYYRAFRHAAERATQSIIIVGWDFDGRTPLARDRRGRVRLTLAQFLDALAKRRPSLEVYVLAWDYGALHRAEGAMQPLYGPGWHPHGRVHVHYDSTNPEDCAHHQKLVVIDDAVAFCGGLDFDPRNVRPIGFDATALVDGDAARALAEIARRRWAAATRQVMRPVTRASDPWPPGVAADAANVTVGISRTMPAAAAQAPVREIEALWVDAIRRVKRTLYIETPYFTSPRIAEGLAARLAAPQPPDVVLVTRESPAGWLDEPATSAMRARLLARLRAADVHRHFGAYRACAEDVPDSACVDCESTVLIADDEWLHVGSASVTQRSMRFDSECALTFEAGGAHSADAIRAFRCARIAAHVSSTPEAVRERAAKARSLNAAIEALSTGGPRRLRVLDGTPDAGLLPAPIDAEAPEPVIAVDALVETFAPDTTERAGGPAWGKLAAILFVIAALTALWRYTPLSTLFTPEHVIDWAEEVGGIAWAPLAVMAAYTPAAFVMFPRPLITLFAVIAFGPTLGLVYSLLGILGAALSTYAVGGALPRDTVRTLAGDNLNEMTEVLRRRGLIAVFAVRIVPVAPFAVEGMVAGAVGIKLTHYAFGTVLGMLPGTLTTTVFGDQIRTALEDPSRINYWLVAAVVLFFAGVIWVVRRWFVKEHRLARSAAA